MSAERQEVLEAATRLLAANPGASTQEIAAAAGISRTTLHRRFPTRDALFDAIGLLAVERVTAAFDVARLEEGPAVAALTRLVEALLPAVHQFAFLLGERRLASSAPMVAADREALELIERVFRRGQVEGTIRFDLPPAWLAYALIGLLLGAEEATRHGAIAPRDTSRLVLQSFFGGAANLPRGDRAAAEWNETRHPDV